MIVVAILQLEMIMTYHGDPGFDICTVRQELNYYHYRYKKIHLHLSLMDFNKYWKVIIVQPISKADIFEQVHNK